MPSMSILQRTRLLRLIDQPAIAPITLVTAPAGYGKSTAVRQWAYATSCPVAWVSLGPKSNNPNRFLAQLAEAIDDACPAQDAIPGEQVSVDVITARLSAIAQGQERPVIVLDDYHQVENDEIHDTVAGLLLDLPVGVHVVFVSRTMPPLPLGRMQMAGSVRHVTEADLRFTLEETAEIVEMEARVRLTPTQVTTLGERTEGWIAGIRLALASLEHVDAAAVTSLIDAWPVHRWLDDYIVEEVLEALPSDVREFVLRTAMLGELTPDLCNAVLGIETSAGFLDDVCRRLAFARPAGRGEAVTYHQLFAECVCRIADRQWPAADRLERHRRAALWYESQGRLESAIEQAVAAEDWEIAIRCARPLCQSFMDRDRHQSRLYWLRKLPEDRVLADLDMARWYITALQYTGMVRESWHAFTEVDPAWRASGEPEHLGYSAACRCFFAIISGEDEVALQLAYEALHHFPQGHVVDRLHAWSTVHQVEGRRGNDEQAEHAYLQAATCRQLLPGEQFWWAGLVELDRVNRLALRGNLRTAHDLYQEMLDALPDWYRSYEAKVRFRLAAIALEWDDLDAAMRQVEAIRRDLDSFPQLVWHMDVLLVLLQVYDAIDDATQVAWAERQLQDIYAHIGGLRFNSRLEALRVAGWLRAGRLGLATEWAGRTQVMDHGWVNIFGDSDPRLTVAQVEIAAGRFDVAEARLRTIADQAQAWKRWAELVPLCMWQVVARLGLGDEAGALASLRTALRHGMPGGFVRSFLTPGHDIAPFLGRIRNELTDDEASYAVRVLGGNASVAGEPKPVEFAVDPDRQASGLALDSLLSDRENDVLALLRSGCTNREIADRLFITERTVKKHVGNILRKLDVPNRTAAVLRAVDMESL